MSYIACCMHNTHVQWGSNGIPIPYPVTVGSELLPLRVGEKVHEPGAR